MQQQYSTEKNIYETGSIKCGWLRKQGGIVKSWQQRWFILKGDFIYYFAKVSDSKSLGSIPLVGNQVNELPANLDDPSKFLFEVCPGEAKTQMTATHETFLLCADSEKERNEWIQAIQKTIYGKKGGAIFGQSLTETMVLQGRESKIQVPLIVHMCVDYIRKHGMESEGIFRLAGRITLIREVKHAFQCAETVNFDEIEGLDVNTVASLLKRYLTELPQPIIPFSMYEPVMKLVTRDMRESAKGAVVSLSELLVTLPKHSYNLLKYVSNFLYEVIQLQESNKMSDYNLATIFANCFIRPDCDDAALLMGTTGGRTLVTRVLISQYSEIFKLEYSPQGDKVEVGTLFRLSKDLDSDNHHNEVFEETTSPNLALLDIELPNSGNLPKRLPARRGKRQGMIIDEHKTVITQNKHDQDNQEKEGQRSDSGSSSDFENDDYEEGADELDALMNTDLFQFSLEEIHEHVDHVKNEITKIRLQYKDRLAMMKEKATKQKVKHKQQVEGMAQVLERERNATSNVVSKVVSLQGQLQAYQMKYAISDVG